MFASNVTPSIIVAGAAGLAFGGAEQVYLIQMAMLFAGIATLFQTVGIGPIGARLPIMQGTSFAFVGVLAGVAATQGLSVALTACIIGGVVHFALGSVIGKLRWLFPPLVTGLVILNWSLSHPGGYQIRCRRRRAFPNGSGKLWFAEALDCGIDCCRCRTDPKILHQRHAL
jgi:xanthine/uracil permease